MLKQDPRKPFIDKALRATYPPGSIFKFATAIAALEDGQATEGEPVLHRRYSVGHGFRCHLARQGHLSGDPALVHIYFCTLPSASASTAWRRWRSSTASARAPASASTATAPAASDRAFYESFTRFKIGYTINSATGQGDVEVTVMQLVMAYAALANGGTLLVPQVIDRVVRADGGVVIPYEVQVKRVVNTPPEVVDVWKRGMYKVVNEPDGSAYGHATSELLTIMGKSGTAGQDPERARRSPRSAAGIPAPPYAWFAGWAPQENPEIAIVVLIEHGGSGGKVAGPVAKAIIEGWWTKVRAEHEPKASEGASEAPGGAP
jgi:penicillin-binding protein 2